MSTKGIYRYANNSHSRGGVTAANNRLCRDCCDAILSCMRQLKQNNFPSYEWDSSVATLKSTIEKGCLICLWMLDAIQEAANQGKHGSSPTEDDIMLSPIECVLIVTGPLSTDSGYSRSENGSRFVFSSLHPNFFRAWSLDVPVKPILQGPVILATHTPENVESESTYKQIQIWLKKCLSSHSYCDLSATTSSTVTSRTLPSRAPTRLIKVFENGNGARLVQAKDRDYTRYVDYVALSHRWFEGGQGQLLSNNLSEYRSEIPKTDLKQAIWDALLIITRMGLDYLWVDSLCIIQDDEEDRAREIARMVDVYSNAAFTIAASGAEHRGEGCFVRKAIDGVRYQLLFDCPSCSRPSRCLHMDLPELRPRRSETYSELESCPLLERAWVYQERFLSPRVVHFCRTEVHWECRELHASEMYPDGKPDGLSISYDSLRYGLQTMLTSTGTQKKLNLMHWWYNIVQEYSKRSLTFQDDRTNAIFGVASFFKGLMDDEYLAGTWKSDFPFSLLWKPSTEGRRTLTGVAPSWSWCGISGAVIYLCGREMEIEGLRRHAKFLESRTLASDEHSQSHQTNKPEPPPQNLTKSWHFRKPGPRHQTIALRMLAKLWRGLCYTVCSDLTQEGSIKLWPKDCDYGGVDARLDVDDNPFVDVACLPLVSSEQRCYGLVLTQVQDQNTMFSRIGYFTAPPLPESVVPNEEITLV